MGLITEGRKETVFNKYKQKIEKERILNSNTTPVSFYDMLINNDFIKQSNFKYLDDAMRLYYTIHEITDSPAEPNDETTSRVAVEAMRSETINLIEDIEFFERNKDKFNENSLSDFEDLSAFYYDVETIKKEASKSQERKISKSGSDTIYSSEDVLIMKPTTYESSCQYGYGTKWCTASRDDRKYWDKYSKDGNLYYVFLKRYQSDNRYYRVAIQTKFDDTFDEAIYWDSLDDALTPKEEELFKMVIPRDALEAAKKDFENTRPDPLRILLGKIQNDSKTPHNLYLLLFNMKINKNEEEMVYIKYIKFFDDPILIDEDGQDVISLNCQIILGGKLFGVLETVEIVMNIFVYGRNFYFDFEYNDTDSRVTDENGTEMEFFSYIQLETIILDIDTALHFSDILSMIEDRLLNNIKSQFRMQIDNGSSNLVKWMRNHYKVEEKKYYGRGFTFEKGGDLTKKLINYLIMLGPNNPVTKKQFLQGVGVVKQDGDGWVNRFGESINIDGYLSSFFAAAKNAGIIKGAPRAFVAGPNLEKYAKKFNLL
jgi:hypothetical protein